MKINAPPALCFDLKRSVDLHLTTTGDSGERAVAGVTSGLIGADHDHYFEPQDGGTRMIDVFDYAAPLGVLGGLAEWLVLDRYMRRLLIERGIGIKTVAESGDYTLPGRCG